jgi:hypothetical protein
MTTKRSLGLPALLYVLAAIGVVTGSYGALRGVTAAATFVKSHDEYEKLVKLNTEALRSLVGPAELEYYGREAEVRWSHRNAALPLAAVGLILSCLVVAGAMRSMRADAWGLSAWRFAAAASIPYQLVSLALELVTAHDLSAAAATLPPMSQLIAGGAWRLTIVLCGVSVLYYGACVIYLRTPLVQQAFSGGVGRTPPSA